MSAASSPATGKPYGVERVCSAAGLARSTFYAREARTADAAPPERHKRGPRPLWSDEVLLMLLRRDLAESPFVGEGHRKVWARLKYAKGVAGSRNRVRYTVVPPRNQDALRRQIGVNSWATTSGSSMRVFDDCAERRGCRMRSA